MKRLSILLCNLMVFWQTCFAQNYDNILNYNFNGTPAHGVKIKTNIPYTNANHMPSIHIEGYSYGKHKTIDLRLVWYIWSGNFINHKISSAGAYAPTVKLANENGKVVIFFDDRVYFQRFTVSAYAQGAGESSSWFSGWSAVDEALTGTNQVTLSYLNEMGSADFDGSVSIQNGNLGVGVSAANSKVEVAGAVRVDEGNNNGIQLSRSYPTQHGHIYYTNSVSDGKLTYMGYYGHRWNTSNGEMMRFTRAGNLGIGTTTPSEKLEVNGTIRTKEVKVETGWADYVFHEDYELKSLSEVSSYIEENHHLPGIPTAEEVAENGIKLGEMNAKLLEKIEELTLYLIEQNKQLQKQNEKIEKQQKEIEILKSKVK